MPKWIYNFEKKCNRGDGGVPLKSDVTSNSESPPPPPAIFGHVSNMRNVLECLSSTLTNCSLFTEVPLLKKFYNFTMFQNYPKKESHLLQAKRAVFVRNFRILESAPLL